jgi:Predicted signal transduction protein with a C-terminal ATPase domain
MGPTEILPLAVLLVFVAGLAATTFIVDSRLADELVENTRASLADRAEATASAITAVLSLAADESANLMASYDARQLSTQDMRVQLGIIQQGLVGCSGAWIVPLGAKPIVSVGTPVLTPASRSWWREYLENSGSGRLGAFGNLGIRRNIGFVAPPFRGSTGIGTILPLVVSYYVGTVPVMTAFFEIDMTVILSELVNGTGPGTFFRELPMEISFYDDSGRLVETTRNIPLVRIPPFARGLPGERPVEIGASLRDYLFPGDKAIGASYKDERINLECVARVRADKVMRGVRAITANVLLIWVVALIAVAVLGLMLMQAFRRARSFEEAQLLARFEALQAKVNPHFLFNTFDSMIGVAEARDYETLMRMLKALSSMLHATVRRNEDIVSLAEELEYVRSYVAIQEVRYRDLFSFHVDCDEEAALARVCSFGVQPLVENCFTHGVHEGRDGMRIRVSARAAGESVQVEVTDDGPGCPAEVRAALASSFADTRDRLGREGGLFNVHQRIRMSFGQSYGLELMDVERGFGVRLTIPRV